MTHEGCAQITEARRVVDDGLVGFELACSHGFRWWERDPAPPSPPKVGRRCTYCGEPAELNRRKCARHLEMPRRQERLGVDLTKLGIPVPCRVCGEMFLRDHGSSKTCLKHRACSHCHQTGGKHGAGCSQRKELDERRSLAFTGRGL